MNTREILDENLDSQNYRLADKATRFVNYLIDTLGFFLIVLLHALYLDRRLGLIPEGGSAFLGFYYFFLYVLYHALFERLTGKTPGKLITGTRVINADGTRPSFNRILLRNACRLIPIDPFSFILLKRGLHDELSGTRVVLG
ncbi:MAG: RDD family protein [Bacteroidetes bacterium]|nr:MAG: RDD family protein [Bacteroidota bacterium]